MTCHTKLNGLVDNSNRGATRTTMKIKEVLAMIFHHRSERVKSRYDGIGKYGVGREKSFIEFLADKGLFNSAYRTSAVGTVVIWNTDSKTKDIEQFVGGIAVDLMHIA